MLIFQVPGGRPERTRDAYRDSPVREFLSDAPFFGLSSSNWHCACVSGWSSTLEPTRSKLGDGSIYKASAVTICIASLP